MLFYDNGHIDDGVGN